MIVVVKVSVHFLDFAGSFFHFEHPVFSTLFCMFVVGVVVWVECVFK